MHTNPDSTRRTFLTVCGATTFGMSLRGSVFAQPGVATLPVTGDVNPALEPFDRLMASFVEEHKVPGAALAVTCKGRLVYARGFGFADLKTKEPVAPDALFRIASVSKPITAVAVMQLVDKGKVSLDDQIADRMKLKPFVARGARMDNRWEQITVRQCLQHTGGFDRDKSFDPIGRPWEIAQALGIKPPVTPNHIVRYMMGQPLDFEPGERFAYSNLGYLILGRIIEAVTGQKYESYVKNEVLGPLGIETMQLGRARSNQQAKGEVRYYDAQNRRSPALYPPKVREQVPLQYGGENFEAFEAHGGWIASAVDLVKFAAAFDDPSQCPILSAKSIEEMWARPDGAAGKELDGKPKDAFYGCGWLVRPIGGTQKSNTWHTGMIAGTEALLVRRWDGLNWSVLFNTQNSPTGNMLSGLIDGRLHEAADKVKAWPDIDQFNTNFK